MLLALRRQGHARSLVSAWLLLAYMPAGMASLQRRGTGFAQWEGTA